MAEMENWEGTFHGKRTSLLTNCYLFETDDPEREQELIQDVQSWHITKIVDKENTVFAIPPDLTGNKTPATQIHVPAKLLSNVWSGLSTFEPDPKTKGKGKWKPVTPQVEGSENYSDSAANPISFEDSLRVIDQSVRKTPTIAVFTGVTSAEDAKALSPPLQFWSHNADLYFTASTVIVCTPDASLFDEQTRKHCFIIEPPVSTYQERETIIKRQIDAFRVSFKELREQTAKDLDNFVNGIVQQTSGLNLHNTASVIQESIHTQHRIESSHITSAKMRMLRSQQYTVVYPTIGWECLGGYEPIKAYFKDFLISMLSSKQANQWRMKGSRGVILFGLHGTGKDLFARIIAKESKLPYIRIDSENIFRGIVGETERNVKRIIRFINSLSPAIVYLPEIDQLGTSRKMTMITDSGTHRAAQNMLMDWLADPARDSFVFGSTNLIEQMDDAFTRTGRFAGLIPMPPPDRHGRGAIFDIQMYVNRSLPHPPESDPLDMEKLVNNTVLWTGSDIDNLVNNAAMLAIKENTAYVKMKHFEVAMKMAPVNLDARAKEVLTFITQSRNKSGVNQDILSKLVDPLMEELTPLNQSPETTTRLQSLLRQIQTEQSAEQKGE